MLTEEQRIRYARNLSVEGFSETEQRQLTEASVLIVGAGALGSVVASYLAASGIGKIGIVDFDTIDVSNLQRQVFYTTPDLGESKTKTLSEHITKLNPLIKVSVHPYFLKDDDLTRRIIDEYDIIVECSDNPSTKLVLERISLEKGKAIVIGGVSQWGGQLMTVTKGHTTFRDLFGDRPSCNGFTPCSSSGVLGPVPGTIATLQSIEVIKLITGLGETLVGRLLSFNGLNMTFKIWKTE